MLMVNEGEKVVGKITCLGLIGGADPVSPRQGINGVDRVIDGGSWRYCAALCRSATGARATQ